MRQSRCPEPQGFIRKVSFSASSTTSKAPGAGPTPLQLWARQVAARAFATSRRSDLSIVSTGRFQLRSGLQLQACSTPSSPSRSLTNEISPATPSTIRSWMNCDSCFISSQSRFASSPSPRSIASIARSIVGRDISPSSSSENHLSGSGISPPRLGLPGRLAALAPAGGAAWGGPPEQRLQRRAVGTHAVTGPAGPAAGPWAVLRSRLDRLGRCRLFVAPGETVAAALHGREELLQVHLEGVENLVGVILGTEADLPLPGAGILDDLVGSPLSLLGDLLVGDQPGLLLARFAHDSLCLALRFGEHLLALLDDPARLLDLLGDRRAHLIEEVVDLLAIDTNLVRKRNRPGVVD